MDKFRNFHNDFCMASFALIFLCLALGIVLRVRRIFPADAAIVLNRFVIYISLPALALKLLHQASLGSENLPVIAMPWILFLLGACFFFAVGKVLRLSRRNTATLILMGSLGNTSFVGFPVLEALFGPHALATGVLIDQPGTFLVCGTLGIFTASLYSLGAFNPFETFRRVFLFPPFQAVVIALLTRSLVFPEWFSSLLERLGATMIPLSLVAVGLQIKFQAEHLRRERRELLLGLSFKLLIAPALIAFIYIGLMHRIGEQTQIVLVESAMAPMITAGILVGEYGLNAELASLMIAFGIPMAIVLAPVLKWLSGILLS